MWNSGRRYEYFAHNHNPEGIVALSAGLAALGVAMVYRAARAIWRTM